MTYQEIVNRIQTIVNDHYQLADFGYGDLSDLKTRFENSSGDSAVQADYPYLFLNPAAHTRNLTTMTYNFNMLVMDMARGEVADQPYNNILAIQSQCQQMIDDVIADLYYGFTDQPEVMRTNMSYTPFNERFQDDVAGMTASLSIEVPTPLNNCITPITHYDEIVTRRMPLLEAPIALDFDGFPDGQDNFWKFNEYSYTGTAPWINAGNSADPAWGTKRNSIIPTVSGQYRLNFQLTTKWNEPEDGSGRIKYGVRVRHIPSNTNYDKFINVAWQSAETQVEINKEFTLDLVAGQEYYFYVAENYAAVPTADVVGYQLAGSKVIISKAQ